jgi:hypothetical protein
MQQADSLHSTTRSPRERDRFVLRANADLHPIDTGETTMVSFKTLAAAVLLSATAATPAFAQAAIQEPGLFAFYYPNLDVLNGGTPTPAARLSRDWPALKGACAAIGAGAAYCGDRYDFRDVPPAGSSRSHGHRRHPM